MYQDVNTDHVKACFKPCFSPVGTNEHAKETEIVYKWQQFLKITKGGKLVSNVLACPDWNDPDETMATDDSPVVKALSLGDIFQFGSGSRFPNFKGSLAFDNQCTDAYKRITGNTCARLCAYQSMKDTQNVTQKCLPQIVWKIYLKIMDLGRDIY